eukprot:365920-Chlamydomonas_euryale.AAC.9
MAGRGPMPASRSVGGCGWLQSETNLRSSSIARVLHTCITGSGPSMGPHAVILTLEKCDKPARKSYSGVPG